MSKGAMATKLLPLQITVTPPNVKQPSSSITSKADVR